MARVYRKITVGPDPKTGMKYIVGQTNPLGVISDIFKDANGIVHIYVINKDNERVEWKDFNANVPIHGEFDIDAAHGEDR